MQPACTTCAMEHQRNNGNPTAARTGIRLAPGVRLTGDQERTEAVELAFAGGKVQLNPMAVAILELCDGSQSREAIVAYWATRAATRAGAEVGEFLRAALARGWIIEGP